MMIVCECQGGTFGTFGTFVMLGEIMIEWLDRVFEIWHAMMTFCQVGTFGTLGEMMIRLLVGNLVDFERLLQMMTFCLDNVSGEEEEEWTSLL